MRNPIAGSEHLERELSPEPIAGPAAGAVGVHLLLLTGLVMYGFIGGLFHHNLWGSQMAGGSMQVNLVSDAIPLPNTQPLNKNVLSTETPSKAPAPPAPKEQHQVDDTAVPILGKHVKPTQKQEQHKTQLHQPPPAQQNVARYGENEGTSIPRAMQPQTSSNGPVAVSDADFGSRFGWYVDQINRKMSSSWYKQEVDPRTPKGARVYLIFSVGRDGAPSNVRLDRSSGSPTLDRSCERGVQRVDTFGSLPAAYNQSTLNVSYYCEY